MKSSGLNTNELRKAYWHSLVREESNIAFEQALAAIDQTSAQVLRWLYVDGYSFKEITVLLNRSISIVRNHHNRGMFQLQQYFQHSVNTDHQ